jgi:pyrroline-5-carboxylate reductase
MQCEIRIAVLGAGNMGSALIGGMLKTGVAARDRLSATVKSELHALELAAKYGIRVTAGANCEAARDADLVILAVKPGTVPTIIREIAEELHEGQIILSVAASLPIAVIESVLPLRLPVFRAMPNIPVVVEEGATAVCSNGSSTQAQRELVESIFRAVGVVCFVEEETMDAVTALSGSGPAYIYMVIEAMIAGGLKMGLSLGIATRLAEQTVLGAAKQVRETGLHPAILRDQVITPGGVTIAAIHELEKHGLRSTIISAIEIATMHSRNRTALLVEKLKLEEKQSHDK